MKNKVEKMLETLKNHREKISVCVNMCISKIMHTSIKVGLCTYAVYVNCRTLKYFVISPEEATEKFHRRSYWHGCKMFAKQNVY